MTTTLDTPPTARQRQIYDFVVAFILEREYPPTRREIQVALGIRNPNGVMSQLVSLRRKGWITWQDGAARTLRPLKGGAA
jgi:repressor LexA